MLPVDGLSLRRPFRVLMPMSPARHFVRLEPFAAQPNCCCLLHEQQHMIDAATAKM